MDRKPLINGAEALLGCAAALASALALWQWAGLVPAIAAGEFGRYTAFIGPIAVLTGAAAVFSFAALFIRTAWVMYCAAALGIFIPFFLLSASAAVLAVAALAVLVSFLAVHRIRREVALGAAFNALQFLRSHLPLYFTAVSLVIAMFYFSALDDERALRFILPRPAFHVVLEFLVSEESPAASFLGGGFTLSPDMTVDEFLGAALEAQLKKEGIAPAAIAPTEWRRLIALERSALEKEYGIAARDGGERIEDVFYRTAILQLRSLLGPYESFLIPASALAFFFAFKLFTFPLYLVTLALVFFLVKALVAAKVLTRTTEQVTVERLSL